MIGSVGEDVIMIRGIMRDGENPVKSGSIGRLVEINERGTAIVFFDGKGRYTVNQDAIRGKAFTIGDSVVLHDTVPALHRVYQKGQKGVIRNVVAENGNYHYNVFIDGECVLVRSHLLRKHVGHPMVISELAKHMINVGSGCNPNTVPEWFQPVVNALKDLPQLSQMGQAQMEFVIKNHMTYRAIDNRRDLVTNVLFVIRACTSHRQLKTMEEKLYGYKEKLDTEWKKLDKIIPIEFQYAALMAYAETLND